MKCGRITIEYTVRCGRNDDHSASFIKTQKGMAETYFRSLGWHRSTRFGWTCPECVETKCVICGRAFVVIKGNQNTCSIPCREEKHRRYWCDPKNKEHQRKLKYERYHNDPEYRAKALARSKESVARRKADPERQKKHREHNLKWQKERARINPAYRQMRHSSSVRSRKRRYQTDPVFREKMRAIGRVIANKKHQERKDDPEYRAMKAQRAKAIRRKSQAQKAAAQLAAVAAKLEAKK